MKSLLSVIAAFPRSRTTRQNFVLLLRFFAVLIGMICIYSVLFHVLMEMEGQRHSWLTGFYWTLTVMTTLGFGDITFEGDAGRFFSMIVLVSGVLFMLVLLPFTFIEFFYAPWMKAQTAARAPRELPANTRGHVILTRHGPVTSVLIPMLEKYGYPYVVLAPTVPEALELHDQGVRAVVGELDNPDTYQNVRVNQAALVVTTRSDVVNTNVTFTVRELADKVSIVASATSEAARGVLELAGATHVLRLDEMMGQYLGRRVIGNDAVAHTIGEIDGLIVAEANASGTPLVGKTLRESGLRQNTGVNVVGVWDHGKFAVASPEAKIRNNTILVLAGTQEQIDAYNELLCIYHVSEAPVIIVGGGRVGLAAGRALAERKLDYRIIDKDPVHLVDPDKSIVGDASHIEVLEKAGIREAASAIVTTHDDDTNIYITILCRRLRGNLQIVSRCSLDRNVATLHRAGADLVLSYGAMGANAIFNLLRGGEILLMAEGINAFPARIPSALAGLTIAESQLRPKTGCTIIAVESEGKRLISPPPDFRLPEGGEMVLIGTLEAEEKFLAEYFPKRSEAV